MSSSRAIGVLMLAIASTAAGTEAKSETVLAYRLSGDELVMLEPDNLLSSSAAPLPAELVLPPGSYQFKDCVYDATEEGLYRFLAIGDENQQRIIWSGEDPSILMNALASMITHGTQHDSLSFEEKMNSGQRSVLSLTCGPAVHLAHQILTLRGFRSRVVQSQRRILNDFDAGHVLLEVFFDGDWVLYDLDGNNVFRGRSGEPLSFLKTVEGLHSGEVMVEAIASDPAFDVGDFSSEDGYDFGFYALVVMGTKERQLAWYRQIMEIPIWLDQNGARYTFECFSPDENQERNLNCISKESLEGRFYGVEE